MAASKSVPRLLQQQPPRPGEAPAWREQQQRPGARRRQAGPSGNQAPSGASHEPPPRTTSKGDLRQQVEASHPSRDREVGDLEQSERETHGRARSPQRPEGDKSGREG